MAQTFAHSAANLPRADAGRAPDIHRRVVYLMLFRLVLISLVLGMTLVLAVLSDIDLLTPASLALFAIIGGTYLLTIVYAVSLRRGADPIRLADIQVGMDLVITSLLIHFTGGAQSAYTFFFPLSIIGAATVRFRAGAVVVALTSFGLFVAISFLGWWQILPSLAGQRVLPYNLTGVELGRALALNSAAFAGVAVLAYNLGTQVQRTAASLQVERTAAADLIALHDDIVRSLSSGLVTVDERGNILTINAAACDILGIAAPASVGVPVDKLLPGVSANMRDMAPRASRSREDLTIKRPDGAELMLGLGISPLRNNEDEVIGRILNFQDLTELRVMEAQVRNAERLATIGTLAAGVAHEIRNPLASISGSIELLRQNPDVDDDERTLMSIINREIDRLNRLINDLLDYTNPRPRKLVELDLTTLAAETVHVVQQDRDFDMVTVELVAPDEVKLVADPEKLRQVIWNLVRNASEAVRDGDGTTVSVRVEADDGAARIVVQDDGRGIAAQDVARLFDPFFTTKASGSGLGLATCLSIVHEHGGTITATSHTIDDSVEGTRFDVRLPREQV